MIRKLLFATDGSSSSERAMHFAASLARIYHAKIIIVHAYIPVITPVTANYSLISIYETKSQANLLVESTISHLNELGITEVESEIVEGPAVNVITGAVEIFRPDILIIGARGLSLWPGSQLGSVSMAVTQRVQCPVLVIK